MKIGKCSVCNDKAYLGIDDRCRTCLPLNKEYHVDWKENHSVIVEAISKKEAIAVANQLMMDGNAGDTFLSMEHKTAEEVSK